MSTLSFTQKARLYNCIGKSNIRPHTTKYFNKNYVNYCRKSKAYYTWQNLGLRFINVMPPCAKNVTNSHFKRVILTGNIWV